MFVFVFVEIIYFLVVLVAKIDDAEFTYREKCFISMSLIYTTCKSVLHCDRFLGQGLSLPLCLCPKTCKSRVRSVGLSNLPVGDVSVNGCWSLYMSPAMN